MNEKLVIIRGGGDIATGIAHKLHRCGFDVIVLETEKPTSIRRYVCFSEAIYENIKTVEGITSKKVTSLNEIELILNENAIPVIIDKNGEYIQNLKPCVVIDSILAKKNLGTKKFMAPITIGIGPGFNAPNDVDCVIESMRGHDLGRLIFEGKAMDNTGIPGNINGISKERVIYSQNEGFIKNLKNIGDIVKKEEVIAFIDDIPVLASIDGVLRGIIRDGMYIKKDLKIADIDPRLNEIKNCYTISDKARSIGGAVLEAILYLRNKNNY